MIPEVSAIGVTPEAPAGGPGTTFTIDQLAAATGLPSRTIRFYQTEGALSPPRRVGRTAIYSREHLERLELIGVLQRRGLRLSAIRDLVRQGPPEALTVKRWLGVEQELGTSWSDESPETVSAAQLTERLAGRPSATLDTLLGAALVTPDPAGGDTFVIPSPTLLSITLALEDAGVDIATASGAGGILRRSLQRAATDLIAFFTEHAGRGFGRRVAPDDLSRALGALRPLGADAVRILFQQEMESALGRLLERSGRTRRGAPSAR